MGRIRHQSLQGKSGRFSDGRFDVDDPTYEHVEKFVRGKGRMQQPWPRLVDSLEHRDMRCVLIWVGDRALGMVSNDMIVCVLVGWTKTSTCPLVIKD